MNYSWAAVSTLAGLLVALLVGPGIADVAVTDRNGRITGMSYDGEWVAVETNVRVPLPQWKGVPSMADARDVKVTDEEGGRTWVGRIRIAEGQRCAYRQVLREADGAVHLDLQITAQDALDVEGVFLFVDVPISEFLGGRCTLSVDDAVAAAAEMPRQKPENRHFVSATANRLTMTSADAKINLELRLDRSCPTVVQDTRQWRGTKYSAFIQLATGPLAKGQSTSLRVSLRLTGEPDHTPARLDLDAEKVRYRLHGFGGNYCFNIESPVTQYTLDNLRVAWARTEMTLREWEPENDNDSPDDTNWEYLEGHDKPDSNLRREFLLAKQIQDRGIPYVISIWRLPEWLYEEPVKGWRSRGGRVHPDKWAELLECVGSYLIYAKRQYGVEPDLFSFNEANIGVYVRFTAQEHRDAIKSIGAHLEKLGLKTKMLLADATGPRGTHTYALPAANDPEAMRYVGAVGFHSWGGATPEQYGAWADLAESLRLPLLVTELGVDAAAWRGRTYDSFHYATREVRMYQEILLYARPQGTMQWEFTSDYGTVKVQKDDSGAVRLVPTQRFWFVKHFCNLTPPNADALTTTSDHPKVLFTAFAAGAGRERAYTLHIANLGPSRPVTVTGVPDGVQTLRAIRTSESEAFEEQAPVPVRDGVIQTELAAQSLLTLTTFAPR